MLFFQPVSARLPPKNSIPYSYPTIIIDLLTGMVVENGTRLARFSDVFHFKVSFLYILSNTVITFEEREGRVCICDVCGDEEYNSCVGNCA